VGLALDQYLGVAGLGVSTRPVLDDVKLRRLSDSTLEAVYAHLRRGSRLCGNQVREPLESSIRARSSYGTAIQALMAWFRPTAPGGGFGTTSHPRSYRGPGCCAARSARPAGPR
jgi:hypothetical protein